MDNKEGIMKYDRILPEDFKGTFTFTNWTDEDFIAIWGGKEYHFPKESTSPIIILDATPVEVQNIRKKFAKNLAEREFFKSQQYKTFRDQEGAPNNRTMSGIHQAVAYTLNELTPFIQRCLEPLPITRAVVMEVQKPNIEDVLSRNDDGELNSTPVSDKTSLKEKALKAGSKD